MGRVPHIAVCDDEPDIRESLAEYLTVHGFRVSQAEGAASLRRLVGKSEPPDLVLLDLRMPGEDGLSLARWLREHAKVGVIMITGSADAVDRIAGLEVGADDYITKPFSMREFRSRVKAALRRSRMAGEPPDEESIDHGELKIDFGRRMVTLHDEEIRVTYVEFEILGALARSPGRVLSRETLLEHVWGDSEYRDPRTVDVHIRHLREKLETDPKEPEFLFTVRGVGYRFRE